MKTPKTKQIRLAIAYDFDGTLAPGNMQERDFIPDLKMTKEEFWNEVRVQSGLHEADNILMYMKLMLDKANTAGVPVHRDAFNAYGQKLRFFKGVLSFQESGEQHSGWFDQIDAYGKKKGVSVEHYIISSGIREMISGSPIAKYFKKIYASAFCYNQHNVAVWPALAVNFTNKTQFLFRINKGALDVNDRRAINEFVPKSERAIPFEQIVFIGDGETDVPCFRVVKDNGGHAMAVYAPRLEDAKRRADVLLEQGRVSFIAPADYRPGKRIDCLVKGIIDKTVSDRYLKGLGKRT